ncbi:MAG: ABC transporter ATP-binding protein [Candidatus Tectomicrobia bacterium]|uniref:ABC transporter ATP-binding protein n=1 Tax=Tectimicrobiota bacterium TaxID=2528274 RepID=A0A932CNT4_UNCTE|nr:ABC transporter ATP-binding protein [Candidatus Tectomicrobia bacterium]
MLKIEGLSKEFATGFLPRRVRALDDLSLEVHRGEVYGYLGHNGAGKTTTLKLILGLLRPTRGRVWLMGRPAEEIEPRARVGFLPEGPYFYDYLTAREFLRFYGSLFGLSRQALASRVDELLEMTGLDRARELPLRRYSKGMLQRVGIAQALINDPEMVILDEPMSGLDPVGRKEIKEIILRLKAEGRTVFFSTHILSDAELLCDRVGILVGGKLVREGSLEELLAGQAQGIEITVENLAAEVASRIEEAAHCVAHNGHTTITLQKKEEIDKLLRLILDCGGKVVSLMPRKATLEDLFWKEFQQTQ